MITWTSDTYYGDSFMFNEHVWKRSTLCRFASMLVLFCSINQPLLFLFLAFSRLMVVKNPFDSKFKSTNYVLKCLIIITTIILSIDVTITAVVGHFKTIPTGMCILFTDPSNAALVFKSLTILITIIQFTSISLIILAYYNMVRHIKESQENIGPKKLVSVGSRIQIILLTLSNVLCWLPSSTVYLAALLLERYNIEMTMWTKVTVMSLNSVINPIIVLIFMKLQYIKKRE